MRAINRLADRILSLAAPAGRARAATVQSCYTETRCYFGTVQERMCCRNESHLSCYAWKSTSRVCIP